jgi:hypothetical protein
MQISRNLIFMSVMQKFWGLCGSIGSVALGFFLISCSSIPSAQRDSTHEEESVLQPRYSIIFIIHGDGNYLYHDSDGNANRADQKALDAARRVAARNREAEVFIFHQKPIKRTLFFFPRSDGKMYYYRHGRSYAEESYRRHRGETRFDPEVKLYHQFRTEEKSQPLRMFLYYGHEIPEFDGTGYDASHSHRSFTVHDLADGLHRFTHDFTRFDLLVLSTCFNGTPYSVSALSPYARTIVASPDNLHLSYFAFEPFEWLDIRLRDGEMPEFANNFARQSFEQLEEDIHTTITVAVYDVDRVKGYVNAVDSVYIQALDTLKREKPRFIDYIDCAEDSVYVLQGMSGGVDIFYRPPRFGRSQNKDNHSGWGCRVFQK